MGHECFPHWLCWTPKHAWIKNRRGTFCWTTAKVFMTHTYTEVGWINSQLLGCEWGSKVKMLVPPKPRAVFEKCKWPEDTHRVSVAESQEAEGRETHCRDTLLDGINHQWNPLWAQGPFSNTTARKSLGAGKMGIIAGKVFALHGGWPELNSRHPIRSPWVSPKVLSAVSGVSPEYS